MVGQDGGVRGRSDVLRPPGTSLAAALVKTLRGETYRGDPHTDPSDLRVGPESLSSLTATLGLASVNDWLRCGVIS